MNFPRIKHAILAALAVGGSLAGVNAHADVFTAGTGNGELTLFVRNTSNNQVYARGLGATQRIDNIATEAQIVADVDYVPVPQPTPETLNTGYTFPTLTADQNLLDFLNVGGTKVWSIMGGDNVSDDETQPGGYRFASTIRSSFDPTTNPQVSNVLITGTFGQIDFLNTALNGTLGGAAGSGDSVPTGGLYGTTGTDGEFALDWFGSSTPTVNDLGSAAGFYLHTASGGPGFDVARVYQIGTFSLANNGTLSFVSATGEPSPVPLPAAAWLLMSGVAGLSAVARRRRAAANA